MLIKDTTIKGQGIGVVERKEIWGNYGHQILSFFSKLSDFSKNTNQAGSVGMACTSLSPIPIFLGSQSLITKGIITTATTTAGNTIAFSSPILTQISIPSTPLLKLNSSLSYNNHPTTFTPTPDPTVHTRKWNWRGYSIRYQCCGETGPALVLIHGFGANSDHWRKNIAVLGKSHRVYSIDLIGYGYSDKPNPRDFGDEPFYTFNTWASQLNDFCLELVQGQPFFICNSIGGLVGLEAAVMAPSICKGIVLLNISLRMLHGKKQPALARPLIKSFQTLLRNTALGKLFFTAVATPQSVRNILSQCYHDTSQVTEELIEKILLPGLEPGAVDVFLEFICYSDGPLPEELLPQVKCPVLIGWGDKDPWEPIELGRAYGNFETVEDFVVLPDVGHCPQDEAPHLVNPLVESFVARHSASLASESIL